MEASSEDESNPPEPTGDAVNADNLPQAGGGGGAGATAAPPAHPVWAAAAGAGRGSGNKQQQRPESMYAPISMMELEIRGRNDLDGASSTTSDRGGGGGRGRPKERSGGRKREKAKKRVREYDDDDDDHDGDREGEECNDDDDDDDGRSAASLDIAGAAFGGAASKKRACAPCGSVAESDDGASVTSSVVRARHARAFPVSGVTCVGCALPAKIAPVTDFIAKNMSTMAELALYKMAALVYKTKVAEPAEEEGVDVPNWGAPPPPPPPPPLPARARARKQRSLPSPFRARTPARCPRADWKEVRAHYQLHAVDSRMQRYENIRTLSAMRKTLEMQLLKRDQETGEQWLDKNNAESIMKVIAASSRELTLLADAGATKKRG